MNAEKAQNEIAKIEQTEGEFRELNSWEDEKSKPAINSRLPMDWIVYKERKNLSTAAFHTPLELNSWIEP